MDLQRIAVKLFVKDSAGYDAAAMISIFHGWIQRTALSELLLIDVANYAHVHEGPGVMLICHEGHFAMDQGGGRLGLLYSNKRLATGSVQDRLRMALHRLLSAAKLLEAEPAIAARIVFACDELLIRVDDRLHAPNTVETFTRLRPDLEHVLADLFNGGRVEMEPIVSDKEAFAVKVSTTAPADVPTLLGRLAYVTS